MTEQETNTSNTFYNLNNAAQIKALQMQREETLKILKTQINFQSLFNFFADKAHFVYELIQNAEDAKASFLRIIIEDDFFYFIHNGKPFSINDPSEEYGLTDKGYPYSDINSITTICKSSKKHEDINEEYIPIGKFGVGFKSVYNYTAKPFIISNGFSIGITDIIVPFWNAHESDVDKSLTCIYFKLGISEDDNNIGINASRYIETTEAKKEILELLKSLTYPHLFLTNVKTIDWYAKDDETIYQRRLGIASNHDELSANVLKYDNCSFDLNNKFKPDNEWLIEAGKADEENFRLFSTEAKHGDSRLGTISIALPIAIFKNAKPYQQLTAQKIYSFFPTGINSYSQLLINAPFSLTIDRANINAYSVENKSIIEDLSSLIIEVIDWLAKEKLLNLSTWQLLPIDFTSNKDIYGNETINANPVVTSIYKKIRTSINEGKYWLPTRKVGEYTENNIGKFSGAEWISKLFNDEMLASLFKPDTKIVFNNVINVNQANNFNYLFKTGGGIRVLESNDIVGKISEQFMLKYSEEENTFLTHFYNNLTHSDTVWGQEGAMMTKPVFLMQDGSFKSLKQNQRGNYVIFKPESSIPHGDQDNSTLHIDLITTKSGLTDKDIEEKHNRNAIFFRGLNLLTLDIRTIFISKYGSFTNDERHLSNGQNGNRLDLLKECWKDLLNYDDITITILKDYLEIMTIVPDGRIAHIAILVKRANEMYLPDKFPEFWGKLGDEGKKYLFSIGVFNLCFDFYDDSKKDKLVFILKTMGINIDNLITKYPYYKNHNPNHGVNTDSRSFGFYDEDIIKFFIGDINNQNVVNLTLTNSNYSYIPGLESYVAQINCFEDSVWLWNLMTNYNDERLHTSYFEYSHYGSRP